MSNKAESATARVATYQAVYRPEIEVTLCRAHGETAYPCGPMEPVTAEGAGECAVCSARAAELARIRAAMSSVEARHP